MVSSNVIITSLIVFFIGGVAPAITGIILLATKKLKGSAFWCGVVAYIIILIFITVTSLYLIITDTEMLEPDSIFNIVLQGIYTVLNTAALAVSIFFILQQSRSYRGAISCGIGFGAVNVIATGLGMISYYYNAVLINSGRFNALYDAALELNTITDEQVTEIKRTFLELTPSDIILSLLNVIAVALLYTAMSIVIIKGLFIKKKFLLTLAAFGMHLAVTLAGLLIPDTTAAVIVITVLGAAALLCTIRLVKEPPQPEPAKPDPFMQSVEGAKKDPFNSDLDSAD